MLLVQAEACDFLEGFMLLQSMAGGTGAGFGAHAAEALADEYRGAQLVNCCVWWVGGQAGGRAAHAARSGTTAGILSLRLLCWLGLR